MVNINKDCRFFKGSKPCVWNKTRRYECASCKEYSPRGKSILIVKLDSIGDVLRSTCIVPTIKEKFPESYLTWITKPESMELLESNPKIDEVWDYHDTETISRLLIQEWDLVYNLDNSYASTALASIAKAKEKIGFVLTGEGITPTNNAAVNWLQMAVFDRVKKENTRSYQEIMYEICDFPLPVCRPCLHVPEKHLKRAKSLIENSLPHRTSKASIIGINTGSGARWPKKMLDAEQIIKVIEIVLAKILDCCVLLLGGPDEVDRNEKIAKRISSDRVTDMKCNHTLLQFAAIVKQCHVLLCGDTLALHMAAALDVPTVAVFGPTSFAEIYDYDGLIEKVRTEELDCLCCYSDCDKDQNCMALLTTDFLAERICKRI